MNDLPQVKRHLQAEQYYNSIESAKTNISNNILLIEQICNVSLNGLKTVKASLNTLSNIPNDVDNSMLPELEEFCLKYILPTNELNTDTKTLLNNHLKEQQILLLRDSFNSLKEILKLINYPEHKKYLFNPDRDWMEVIDCAIEDFKEVTSNKFLFKHSPKHLVLSQYNENYYLNNVKNIREFGKNITYVMREIARLIKV
jgi:hypothetical protein